MLYDFITASKKGVVLSALVRGLGDAGAKQTAPIITCVAVEPRELLVGRAAGRTCDTRINCSLRFVPRRAVVSDDVSPDTLRR